MKPIIVSEVLDIYWFPSCSPTRKECIWFAVHHIKRYKGISKKETNVFLSNGKEIKVKLSAKALEFRIQRAYTLKYLLEKRTKHMLIQNDRIKTMYWMKEGIWQMPKEFIVKEDDKQGE